MLDHSHNMNEAEGEGIMAINIQDVVSANLVLVGIGLLNTPEELEDFREGIDATEIVSRSSLALTGPLSDNAETGRTFALERERIVLEISSSRSSIERAYPLKGDLERLANVAGHAIAKTDLQGKSPRAFGFNLELVYDQTSEWPSVRYLAERLFSGVPPGNEGWQLFGGMGRLIFKDGDKFWTVKLEPRFNEHDTTKILLSINLHRNEQRLPDKGEIRDSLCETWDQAHEFAVRLDKKKGE